MRGHYHYITADIESFMDQYEVWGPPGYANVYLNTLRERQIPVTSVNL